MKKSLRRIYQAVPFKNEIFTALKLIWQPPSSVYQHLHFKGVFEVPVADSSFLLEHHGAQVENSIFWAGLHSSWEGQSLALWTALCKDAKVIVDVGANTGVYALVAKAVNPNAKVIAFEPVRRVYEKLLRNCELNQYDIACHEQALSNFDGKATIYDLPGEHVYSVTVNRNWQDPGTPVVETQIETVRFATYLNAQSPSLKVDLMKIDVETHEVEVLEGMGKYLARDRPTLLIEILEDPLAAKIEEMLAGLDYLYFNISETAPPRRQQKLSKSDGFNFLLCHSDVARNLGLT